ncbi:MAG: AEC family transporter, partial [Planctomycetaceae bacterium]|nr:AEC family transporter [Planctomycetaceae bacterium]
MILNALAPVFFVMYLGYFAGRRRLVDNLNVANLNVLVMTFALPAALFTAISRTPQRVIIENGKLMLVLTLAMLIIFVVELL